MKAADRKARLNLLILCLTATILTATAAPARTAPSLQVKGGTAAPGGEARLKLSLNGDAAGVCGLSLTVTYEDAVPDSAPRLELVGPGQGRLAPPFTDSLYAAAGVFNPDTTLPYDYRRRVVVVHGEPVDGPADVIELPFKVPPSAAPGTVYAVSVKVDAYDLAGRKVTVDGAAAGVTVVAPTGDVDGNGQVDVQDAILILRHVSGLETLSPERLARADLDGSGGADVTDAVRVLRLAVGLEG